MTALDRKARRKRKAEQAQMAALGIPDFETAEDCQKSQQSMIRALGRAPERHQPLDPEAGPAGEAQGSSA